MIYNLMYDIPHYLVSSKQFPNIVYESVMEVKYRIESRQSQITHVTSYPSMNAIMQHFQAALVVCRRCGNVLRKYKRFVVLITNSAKDMLHVINAIK